MEIIKNISCSSNKKFVRVSREIHVDGEPHLHVLIQFEGRVQLYNPRHFDITHPSTSTQFHPNIQGAKSSFNVKKYIEKGGYYVDWGEFQRDSRPGRRGMQDANKAYAKALNTCNTQLALDTIKDLAPQDYIMQFHNISNNLTRIFETPIAVYKSKWERSSFLIPDNIQQWIGEAFIDSVTPPAGPELPNTISFKLNRSVDRPMSIILEGASRKGKTAWARSLGKNNYISGHLDFNKKTFSNDVEYNVIDDITPKYLSIKHLKELIGAQHDWQSICKYSKPVLIKGGVPAIILCNPGEGTSDGGFLEKPINTSLNHWTDKNGFFEFIDGPLFQEQTRETGN